jgi:hypothetical protein
VLLRANTRGARYPLRIDPFIQQGEKLVGSGQAGPITPRFGYRVALSSDGNTALIGGPADYGETGAAWVLTRSGETWTQQGSKLTGTGESGEGRFGSSVALSSDGNTALIGAPFDNKGDGAAWVFTRSEGKWTQQGSKLVGTEQKGNSVFGFSVALSSNGNTALMGGPSDARIVETEGEVTEKSKIVKGISSTTGIEVGTEVGGEKIPIETHVVNVISSKEVELSKEAEGSGKVKLTFTTTLGAAWVFTRAAETWTQQAKLAVASGELGPGRLGKSVALSGDGNTALLGGPGDNSRAGAAWVFTFSASKWEQQAKLAEPLNSKSEKEEITSEALPGELGASVALASNATSGTANTALLGAPGDNKGVGAAWVYTGSGSSWTKQGAKLTGSGEVSEEPGEKKFPGRFGASVALSSAESGTATSTALIGGPGDSKGVGAAWVFTRSSSTWSQQAELKGTGEVSSEAFPGEFGASVALSSNGNTALMGGPGDSSNFGAAWAFTRSETTWTQQGSKLTGTGASGHSKGGLGSSVALSSDGNTALIGGPEDGAGAAWVFTRSGSTWTQQGSKLTGAEEVGEAVKFGASVALSSDGNTALIGGPGDARIVEREGEVTEKLTIVKGLPSTSGIFIETGVSGAKIESGTVVASVLGEHEVELSKAVEGAGSATVKEKLTFTKASVGSTWVFTRSGSTWSQQGSKLSGGEEVGEAVKFGDSVALSATGNTALIGGPSDKGLTGATWVFLRNSEGKWTQWGPKLTGTGASGSIIEFGSSVALSSDGNTALIGGPFDGAVSPKFEPLGAAWVFARSGSTWSQLGSKLTGGVEEKGGGEFGTSLALSANGSTALIGGSLDNSELGASWVFTRSGSTWTQQGAKLTGTGESGKAEFGSSVALSSEGNTALIGGLFDSSQAGATWLFTRNSKSEWAQQEKLTGSGAAGTIINFGASVALSSEGNTALIGGPGDAGHTGAAWVLYQNLPTVVTEHPAGVTNGSATLNAKVNPDGSEVSACTFEYGTTESYGSTQACSALPGSGTSAVAVSAAISGLAANKTYHYRISATNASGTSKGLDQTFTTPFPTVVTGAASFTQTSATLNATVNPNGVLVSECRFEYGTSIAYGSSAPCEQSPGSGTEAVPVSAALESLAENTTYHFRIVATNTNGTTFGSDATFTTLLVLGPHWYQNHVRLAESGLEKGKAAMSWGSLTLENAKTGVFTCQTLGGGRLVNPTGGGAGKGFFDAVTLYDCAAPTCEATKGLGEVIRERLKWSSVLIEEAGSFKDRIEGIALREICVGGTSERNVEFHGMLKATLENGTAIGSAPTNLVLNAGSGSLQSVEGAGKVSARLKLMGFEGGEILSAKET